MKKKVITGCCILLVLIILGGFLYVGIGRNNLENKMWDYLEQENYSETDIQSLEVKHSFMNILLSYNEWFCPITNGLSKWFTKMSLPLFINTL